MKNLKIGQQIAHKGKNENEGICHVVNIVAFDGLAIQVENKRGSRYFINKWEICPNLITQSKKNNTKKENIYSTYVLPKIYL